MIPEALLRALKLIYASRYGGEWDVKSHVDGEVADRKEISICI